MAHHDVPKPSRGRTLSNVTPISNNYANYVTAQRTMTDLEVDLPSLFPEQPAENNAHFSNHTQQPLTTPLLEQNNVLRDQIRQQRGLARQKDEEIQQLREQLQVQNLRASYNNDQASAGQGRNGMRHGFTSEMERLRVMNELNRLRIEKLDSENTITALRNECAQKAEDIRRLGIKAREDGERMRAQLQDMMLQVMHLEAKGCERGELTDSLRTIISLENTIRIKEYQIGKFQEKEKQMEKNELEWASATAGLEQELEDKKLEIQGLSLDLDAERALLPRCPDLNIDEIRNVLTQLFEDIHVFAIKAAKGVPPFTANTWADFVNNLASRGPQVEAAFTDMPRFLEYEKRGAMIRRSLIEYIVVTSIARYLTEHQILADELQSSLYPHIQALDIAMEQHGLLSEQQRHYWKALAYHGTGVGGKNEYNYQNVEQLQSVDRLIDTISTDLMTYMLPASLSRDDLRQIVSQAAIISNILEQQPGVFRNLTDTKYTLGELFDPNYMEAVTFGDDGTRGMGSLGAEARVGFVISQPMVLITPLGGLKSNGVEGSGHILICKGRVMVFNDTQLIKEEMEDVRLEIV